MKKLLSVLCLLSMVQLASFSAIVIEDLKSPQEHYYRVGTTDTPEKKVDYEIETIVKPTVKKEVTIQTQQALTYADLSIKKMALEVSKSLEIDYADMQADLSLLWQGAATRSDTIKFAIYKLSNPDKDKPDSGAVKKVLSVPTKVGTFLFIFLFCCDKIWHNLLMAEER